MSGALLRDADGDAVLRPVHGKLHRKKVLLPPDPVTTTATQRQLAEEQHLFSEPQTSLSSCLQEAMRTQRTGCRRLPAELPLPVCAFIEKIDRFKGPVQVLVEKMPSVKWFFVELSDLLDQLMRELEELGTSNQQRQSTMANVAQHVQDSISRVELACRKQIGDALVSLKTRDAEIDAAEKVNETLAARLKELESQNTALKRSLRNYAAKEAEHDHKDVVRSSQLEEIRTKSHVIVQENVYLRQICRHNRDLLEEINELRQGNSAALEQAKEQIQRVESERDACIAEVVSSRDALRRLAGVSEGLQVELSDARKALRATEEQVACLRSQMDNTVGRLTPRPGRAGLQEVIGIACTALGEPRVQIDIPQPNGKSSAKLVEELRRLLRVTSQQLLDTRVLAERQAKALEYMSFDDFESMMRGISTSSVSLLGDATDESAPKAQQNVVLPAPMHSRTSVGRGLLRALGVSLPATPLCTAVGLVGCRLMSLEEVLLTVDEARAERKAGNGAGAQATFGAHIRSYFLHKNASNAVAGQEALMSFEYSLDVHRYIPQVELIKRIALDQTAPEELYSEALGVVDFLCREMLSLSMDEIRPGNVGRTPVKFVRRKSFMQALQRALPTASDAAMNRLKCVMQMEMSRVAKVDPKLPAILAAKDEIVVDALLGTPTAEDVGGTAMIALGSKSGGAAGGAFLRHTGSSVMMPFSAAVFRAVVDEYDTFLAEASAALCRQLSVNTPSPVTSSVSGSLAEVATAHPAWDEVLRSAVICRGVVPDSGSILQWVTRCAGTNSDLLQRFVDASTGKTVAEILQSLWISYFPPTVRLCRFAGDSIAVADGGKAIEASKKSVLLLRASQK